MTKKEKDLFDIIDQMTNLMTKVKGSLKEGASPEDAMNFIVGAVNKQLDIVNQEESN